MLSARERLSGVGVVVCLLAGGWTAGCGDDELTFTDAELSVFEPIPAMLQVDQAKVSLGNVLYHDPGLSGDASISCATCHAIAGGGDDGLMTSKGINGEVGPINAPTVLNAAFNPVQFWDGRAATLEEQAGGPVTNPIEMGGDWSNVFSYLSAASAYDGKFDSAFGGPLTAQNTTQYVTEAIAEFERTLITPNSKFDAFLGGNQDALNERERRGLRLFLDNNCQSCHAGVLLGGEFKMLAISYLDERGNITETDYGRYNVTMKETDRYVFKVPTLRNVELTAPYFHDGTQATLGDAVRAMAEHQLATPFTAAEAEDMVAFLETLTGDLPNL